MAMLPPPPPTFTLQDAMILCGVDDASMFGGVTAAERIAADLFDNDFTSAMDKTWEELDVDFKSYADLTQNQG